MGFGFKSQGSANFDLDQNGLSVKDIKGDIDFVSPDIKGQVSGYIEDNLSLGAEVSADSKAGGVSAGASVGISVDGTLGFQGSANIEGEVGDAVNIGGEISGEVGYSQESGDIVANGEAGYTAGIDIGPIEAKTEDSVSGSKTLIDLDPIVIDLDGDGVELVGLDQSSAFVDVDKDDYQENTGWAHQDDGILAIDLDGSGDVNDAAEFQFAGETNTDDTDMEAFRALYDSNDDGVFDPNDSDWHKAGIWRDLNQNGRIAEYV